MGGAVVISTGETPYRRAAVDVTFKQSTRPPVVVIVQWLGEALSGGRRFSSGQPEEIRCRLSPRRVAAGGRASAHRRLGSPMVDPDRLGAQSGDPGRGGRCPGLAGVHPSPTDMVARSVALVGQLDVRCGATLAGWCACERPGCAASNPHAMDGPRVRAVRSVARHLSHVNRARARSRSTLRRRAARWLRRPGTSAPRRRRAWAARGLRARPCLATRSA